MQNELPEKINSLLNDLNSNSAPKILNAMEKLEKYGVPDYRVIYAIREYSVSAVSPFFHYKATRLADKLEALASRFLNRPISQLTDRELMEKIAIESFMPYENIQYLRCLLFFTIKPRASQINWKHWLPDF